MAVLVRSILGLHVSAWCTPTWFSMAYPLKVFPGSVQASPQGEVATPFFRLPWPSATPPLMSQGHGDAYTCVSPSGSSCIQGLLIIPLSAGPRTRQVHSGNQQVDVWVPRTQGRSCAPGTHFSHARLPRKRSGRETGIGSLFQPWGLWTRDPGPRWRLWVQCLAAAEAPSAIPNS